MALMSLKSDLSWYGKKPTDGPYRPPTSRTDTRFIISGPRKLLSATIGGYEFQGVQQLSPVTRFVNDKFAIDDITYSSRGDASRGAQGGTGFPFPGGTHKYDKTRTGFSQESKYTETYGVSIDDGLNGLANTYTIDSPIDDMYNKFNLRDDATPNPGYAKQPFILRGIQRPDKGPQRWGLGDTLAGKISSTFGIPRGGILSAGERTIIDALRIGKFIISPSGIGFVARQIGYQLMNPMKKTRLWNPLSLGSIAPIVHINRHIGGGIADSLLNLGDDSDLHEDLRKELFSDFNKDNKSLVNTGGEIKTVSSKFGGPDSILGIGGTSITRYSDTSLKTQLEGTTNAIGSVSGLLNMLAGASSTNPRSWALFELHRYSYDDPFIKHKDKSESGKLIGRSNTGDLYDGSKTSIKKNYTSWPVVPTERGGDATALQGGGISSHDGAGNTIAAYTKMAYGDIPSRQPTQFPSHHDFREKSGMYGQSADAKLASNRPNGAKWTDTKIDDIDKDKDKSLIKFQIGSIKFKAYLDSLEDGFAPDWSGEQDQGRADQRYQYGGFERTVSTGFLVPILSEDQRASTWQKLSDLADLTYPVYGSQGFYGQRTTMTIGDLYVNKSVIITDLGYSWDNETPWEITDGIQAPYYTQVSISFTLLGSKPQKGGTIYNHL